MSINVDDMALDFKHSELVGEAYGYKVYKHEDDDFVFATSPLKNRDEESLV